MAELMVALVIAGIIGAALARLVINQSRFVAQQEATMRARAGARAGFNVALQELRMIGPSGLLTASRDSITVRVPFAFGVACSQPSGGVTAVALLPYDSATYATATLSGYAWRDTAGIWNFEETSPSVSAGASTNCTSSAKTNPPISLLTNGIVVHVAPNNPATTPGSPVYLYQKIRYALAASTEITGREALWRTVLSTNTREELVAPFDTASRFKFLVGNALTSQAAVPSSLDSVKGIQLRLVGQSEDTPEGKTSVSTFDLTTNIVFVNRVR